MADKTTLALIIGTRDFFPAQPVHEGRSKILTLLQEMGMADTIKLTDLHVPILVQANPDDPDKLMVELRRDAFCGKISVCNNLYQYGFPFSLTEDHTVEPTDEAFQTYMGWDVYYHT